MTELSSQSRALLARAREDFSPTEADRTRVERAIAVQLGIAAGAAALASSVSSSGIGATTAGAGAGVTGVAGAAGGSGAGVGVASTTLTLATKWAIVATTAVSVSVGGVVAYQEKSAPSVTAPMVASSVSRGLAIGPNRKSTDPRPSVSAPPAEEEPSVVEASPAEEAVLPASASTPSTARMETAGSTAISASPTKHSAKASPFVERRPHGVASPPRSNAQESVPAAASVSGTKPRSASLVEETRLLREAYAALRSSDPQLALRLLDEHARRFPRGVLSEERSAQRIVALCNLGRLDEARAEAARFSQRSPASPLMKSILASCIADSNSP